MSYNKSNDSSLHLSPAFVNKNFATNNNLDNETLVIIVAQQLSFNAINQEVRLPIVPVLPVRRLAIS